MNTIVNFFLDSRFVFTRWTFVVIYNHVPKPIIKKKTLSTKMFDLEMSLTRIVSEIL